MTEEPRDLPGAPTGQPHSSTTPDAPLPGNSALAESKPANQLTPDEQMALFEKELKETDWGHQPC